MHLKLINFLKTHRALGHSNGQLDLLLLWLHRELCLQRKHCLHRHHTFHTICLHRTGPCLHLLHARICKCRTEFPSVLTTSKFAQIGTKLTENGGLLLNVQLVPNTGANSCGTFLYVKRKKNFFLLV